MVVIGRVHTLGVRSTYRRMGRVFSSTDSMTLDMHHRHRGKSAWTIAGSVVLAMAEVVCASTGPGDDGASQAKPGVVDYASAVKPILTRHCVSCHGAAKPRGGLRLDTIAAALKGGKAGPAIVPGHGSESPLIAAVRGDGEIKRMPLNRPPLATGEIELLERWIDQGPQVIPNEAPGWAPSSSHWAFVAPRKGTPPAVKNSRWPRNPIDRFVLARLEKAGLQRSAAADKAVLLRRVSLDLIGLPPSTDEIDRFVADDSRGAYERAVDRLLASPHYGERWARPWLDQARYADSNGYNIDAPRSIWKYRDWVIAAFNSDMPFDRFATDQIAGDLEPTKSLSSRIATGFHRNTQINQEGGIDVEQFRIESVIDRVNTTGTVFLGLTIGCAQCHDHKYDPISQRDYYQLFAFFNNVDEPELDIATPAELARRKAVNARIDAWHKALADRYPDLDERERNWERTLALAFTQSQTADVRLAFDLPREKRSGQQRRALVELMVLHGSGYDAERMTLESLKRASPSVVTTMVVQERSGEPRPSYIHLGGDFTRKGELVLPGVPTVLPRLEDDSPGTPPDRLDLARWLVNRRNPLTARVVVNRIWQVYFGRGLVETDNDLGTQGTLPSHPELLDWLASELMDQGWSQKAIHRLIVCSATYQQASSARSDGQAIDPDNRLYWRQNRLRLDAELIRDAALACSGLLTRKIGGPSVFPPQPDGVMNLGQMRRPWQADTGPDRYRRGLYTFFWRATPHPFLTTFDAPGGVQTCTRRFRSNTPLQALTLLNDPAFVEIAEALATTMVGGLPENRNNIDRLRAAFRRCLGRAPTNHELEVLEPLLDGSPDHGQRLKSQWMTVARVLLNLDEFVTRE